MVNHLKYLLFPLLLGLSTHSYALDESQADDMADLTAVFIYLKNDCGYQEIPDLEIRDALLYFAKQNRWDLANYNQLHMQQRGEASYRDLSGIPLRQEQKCHALAERSLGLLSYVGRNK